MLHDETLADLLSHFPHEGRVEWIGIRPERRALPVTVDAVEVTVGGLIGDHYSGRNGKRAVTLIQAEHLKAIASLTGNSRVDPALLRRNIVVSGLNLVALKDRRFRIGSALLEGTGACDPCSRMEENLGKGGLNAMRGHGGLNARVIEPGFIRIGDAITVTEAT
ncbi:MAG TPA: MOSC domain-containing protein [Burkholderiales bacterium]|nr:MOSC domain-containing protein [Burkholderiales bacterium]